MDQELARAAKETVLELRKVQRTIERAFPEITVGSPVEDAKPSTQTDLAETQPTPAETAAAEARVAAALVRAGTTAGVVSGRPITDPPGYKRVQRLQQVRAAVEQAARKKGLQKTVGH